MRESLITRRGGVRLLAALAALLALGVFSAACGSTNPSDPTPVKTFKITPATGGQNTPTPAPAATATSASGGGGGATISIVGINSTFDKDKLSAPAGAITIEFDNKDSGVPHNIHFHKGAKVSDPSVGSTALEPGPVKQTLKLDLTAGDYFYQCDVHPATMKGILTVS